GPGDPLALHPAPPHPLLPGRDRLRPLPAHHRVAERVRAGAQPAPAAGALMPEPTPGSTPPRLFLVDGYALIYRAFFAMITRPLRTSAGENTSAAWGVVNFLLRLRERWKPERLAWVND